MKNRFMVISIVLLTLTPIKLLTMEIENPNDEKLIVAIKKLTNLIPSQENVDSLPWLELISTKFPDFITTTEDSEKLREGIFAITEIFTLHPPDNDSELIKLRKLMYYRLAILKKTKEKAKEFCYGITDDISDSEEKKPNITRRNYLKYLAIKERIEALTQEKNNISLGLKTFEEIKVENAKLIEELKTKEIDLTNLIKDYQKEFDTITTAYEILNSKKSIQEHKMQEQGNALVLEIDKTNETINQLTEQSSTLTDLNGIQKANKDLEYARQKLAKLKNVLSYLNKDFAEINGKTGYLSNLAWILGLYNFGNNKTIKND